MLKLQLLKMKIKQCFCILTIALFASCAQDYVPKPKAFLRLDYPEPKYSILTLPEEKASFKINTLVDEVMANPIASTTKTYGINLKYNALKATVFLTYKSIDNNPSHLKSFLRDAQKLTLEHTKKADEIPAFPFEDSTRNVYGLLSEVKGNVASTIQFYVTDSTNHFLTGSLYFKAKPNYDSILPAVNYIKKDIRQMIETLKWEEQRETFKY